MGLWAVGTFHCTATLSSEGAYGLYGLRLMHRLNIFLSCHGHSGWAGLSIFLFFYFPNPNPSDMESFQPQVLGPKVTPNCSLYFVSITFYFNMLASTRMVSWNVFLSCSSNPSSTVGVDRLRAIPTMTLRRSDPPSVWPPAHQISVATCAA